VNAKIGVPHPLPHPGSSNGVLSGGTSNQSASGRKQFSANTFQLPGIRAPESPSTPIQITEANSFAKFQSSLPDLVLPMNDLGYRPTQIAQVAKDQFPGRTKPT